LYLILNWSQENQKEKLSILNVIKSVLSFGGGGGGGGGGGLHRNVTFS
jgi:hypothetical protein